jgi:hypothetical protein
VAIHEKRFETKADCKKGSDFDNFVSEFLIDAWAGVAKLPARF